MQSFPKPASQPAVAIAARPAELHLVELHGNRIHGPRWQRPVIGEQTQFAILAAILVKDFQRPAPGFLLAVVDLAEVQNLPLRTIPTAGAAILDDAEVSMRFPILAAFVVAQKHDS